MALLGGPFHRGNYPTQECHFLQKTDFTAFRRSMASLEGNFLIYHPAFKHPLCFRKLLLTPYLFLPQTIQCYILFIEAFQIKLPLISGVLFVVIIENTALNVMGYRHAFLHLSAMQLISKLSVVPPTWMELLGVNYAVINFEKLMQLPNQLPNLD